MRNIILICVFLILTGPCLARTITVDDDGPAIIYVDSDAPGLNDGTSWENAFIDLQQALSIAEQYLHIEEIRVAQGIYTPTEPFGEPEETFQLINGIALKGGYAGFGEPDPNGRDVQLYETILSGDLNGNDIDLFDPQDIWSEPTRADNCEHVVTSSECNQTTVLDGFTITAGRNGNIGAGMYNRDSNPTVTNCTFAWNGAEWGGGMGNENSNPTVIDCLFEKNWAIGGGGGIINWESSNPILVNCTFNGNIGSGSGGGMSNKRYSNPKLTNCTFTGNSTNHYGGGVYNLGGNPTITNCIFTGNAAERGGAICSYGGGTPILTNCILWDNTAPYGHEIYLHSEQQPSTITVGYSDVQGGAAHVYVETGSELNWAEGNIDTDPCFASITDYHLMSSSPCIDAGTNDPCGGLPTTDKDGTFRLLDGDGDGNSVVDMGAYEYNPSSSLIVVSAISFFCVEGGPKPAAQTLLIRNCGAGTLNWEIVEDCNWLEVMPTIGSSTGEIDEVAVMLDHNGLSPGYYTFVLTVRDPNASNSPVTIHVPVRVGALLEVPDEYETIQSAIDDANDRDIIIVADGIYTGEGNRDIDFKGKAITVRSENGPENCIIDCNGTRDEPHRGFFFLNDEESDSVLDGFTITGGNRSVGDRSGGAILCGSSSPKIINCAITGNLADHGGGIYCWRSSPKIINCAISGNLANHGSGICCLDSNPTITNCTITGNSAEIVGGGIYCRDSSTTITNCTIAGNSARNEGGGIYCRNSSTTITNCTIAGNSAEDKGGGIYCRDSSTTITNCTITGNSAEDEGGGIYCRYSSPTITNCILWANVPDEIYISDSMPVITYTNIQGDWVGKGNIDADPCFVEAGDWYRDENGTPNYPRDDFWVWTEGDYHLRETSPCIDTGDPNYLPEPNETDLDGNPRIVNSRVDMGAYEYIPPVEVELKLTPQMLNCDSHGNWLKAHVIMPEGIYPEDIDVNTPAVAEPPGTESEFIEVNEYSDGYFDVQIYFDREIFCQALSESEEGLLEVTVTGSFITGGTFEGTDTIRLLGRPRQHLIRRVRSQRKK